MTNTCTRKEAEQIAKEISGYWMDRGFVIQTEIIRALKMDSKQVGTWGQYDYFVRSNLMNGAPRKEDSLDHVLAVG